MTQDIIETSALTRVYQTPDKDAPKKGWFSGQPMKDFVAVSALDLAIKTGEKVAFIGPNGAGKSTTLKMLCGLLHPTSGTATVCDKTPWLEAKELSREIGLVFGQKTVLWPHLSVKESYDLLARIYDLDPVVYQRQVSKLIEVFGLESFLSQYGRTLSLGQRMRSEIAAALLHQPKVLFLDEPTIGLDVTAKALLRDHLNKLVSDFEMTVLLTSHDTDDIEKICERVILIDHGKKLLDTTLPQLQKDYTRFKTLILATAEQNPTFVHPHVQVEEQGDHKLVLKVDIQNVDIESIVSQCLSLFSLRDIAIEDMPLEDIIRAIYARKGVLA